MDLLGNKQRDKYIADLASALDTALDAIIILNQKVEKLQKESAVYKHALKVGFNIPDSIYEGGFTVVKENETKIK